MHVLCKHGVNSIPVLWIRQLHSLTVKFNRNVTMVESVCAPIDVIAAVIAFLQLNIG